MAFELGWISTFARCFKFYITTGDGVDCYPEIRASKEYRTDDGTTNNLAESYFARFRRMQYGQTHRFGNLYLNNYANEAAYREDTRRESNGAIFIDIAKKCALTRTSRDWCGYWQGNKRPEERLAA